MIDFLDAILNALRMLANPLWVDPSSGRLRVFLDAAGGAQTLAAVSTVSAVTTMNQVAAIPANSVVFDAMTNCWANTVRRAIA